MTRGARALPTHYPTTIREAAAAVTALRDAARAFHVRDPQAARQLELRAARITEAAVAAHERELGALAARGRWAARPWKSGPLTKQGIGHVTVFGDSWSTTDTRHPTMCGRVLTGRNVTFGEPARPGYPAPDGWDPCGPCTTALAALAVPVAS